MDYTLGILLVSLVAMQVTLQVLFFVIVACTMYLLLKLFVDWPYFLIALIIILGLIYV